jgi:NAD(P)-dependent dehydrogenase (short-subunit alcohol dehydrogenase family)
MEISGKAAVVVGGASGMAKATAEMLVREGARVSILDLATSAGAEVAKELGGGFHACDVTDFEGTEAALSAACDKLGALHFVCNTAGGGIIMRTLSRKGPHPLDDFRRVIDLNLVSTFNIARLAAARMSENEPDENGERGVIINTASIAAFEGQIGQVAYTAAKAGIAGMSLTMARDLGSPIRVMAIAPSLFATASPGDPGRDGRATDPGRRVPQAHGEAPGVCAPRPGDLRDADAERRHDPPRRWSALRAEVESMVRTDPVNVVSGAAAEGVTRRSRRRPPGSSGSPGR